MSRFPARTGVLTLTGTSQQDPAGSRPHGNMQPFQCVSFIISLFGIFPTPT